MDNTLWIQNVLLRCPVRVDWNLILLIIMIIIITTIIVIIIIS